MEPQPRPNGPPDSVRAAAAALRSRRHAQMLFDAVVDQLGDSGWQETANGGAIRRLFRRDPVDPTQIVPWSVLELSSGSRGVIVADWMGLGDAAPVEPPPPPAPLKLRGLGPGELRMVDGAEHIEVSFNEEGTQFESCRSQHAHPLAGLAQALAEPGGNPIDLLARFVAGFDPGRHGPGRVLLPVPLPRGAAGVWQCGLQALRRALFDDGGKRGADWAVADGLTGRALGFGASREQAMSSWRAVVAECSPWPEPRPVQEPPDDLPPGTMLIRAPSSDVPTPDRVPGNVPAALVRLAATPVTPPSFGSWVALLGSRGATSFAACRRKRKGFTLVGQHVLGAVDLDRIDAEMERVDAEYEARMSEVMANATGGADRWPCWTTVYRVVERGRLQFDAGSQGPEWHAGALDGDVIAHRVVRQRWRA